MAAAIWVQLCAPNPLYARVASSHNVLTTDPSLGESREKRESSAAPCQALLGGTSGFFRSFKSE